jgi:hypothetical protein
VELLVLYLDFRIHQCIADPVNIGSFHPIVPLPKKAALLCEITESAATLMYTALA